MKTSVLSFLASVLVAAGTLSAAESFTVTVSHDLDIARPGEVVVVPWKEVSSRLPGVTIDHFVVRSADGKVIPAQVTNFQPELKTGNVDDLIFQHDFAAGEKSATFTVEKTAETVPPFPTKTFGRFAPDRFDDFSWENDVIAHRIYGTALDTDEPKRWQSGRLRSSGIDIWCKRVSYPIVNRWLLKGHDHYHKDTGEGLDMYDVGTARGCGGLGIWSSDKLHTSGNYKNWKVLANGPIRTVFELTYETWDADGVKVSEVKRFTVDAGRYLDQIESTFSVEGAAKELTVGIGLGKQPKASKTDLARGKDNSWMSLWQQYPPKLADEFGELGTGVVLSPGTAATPAEDKANHLVLVKATPGQALRYYAGAGWNHGGDIVSAQKWNAYLTAFTQRLAAPVRLSFEPAAATKSAK